MFFPYAVCCRPPWRAKMCKWKICSCDAQGIIDVYLNILLVRSAFPPSIWEFENLNSLVGNNSFRHNCSDVWITLWFWMILSAEKGHVIANVFVENRAAKGECPCVFDIGEVHNCRPKTCTLRPNDFLDLEWQEYQPNIPFSDRSVWPGPSNTCFANFKAGIIHPIWRL